jgi:signal peptidase I
VAIAGDTLQIIEGQVMVNGTPQEFFPGIQNTYTVKTNGTSINQKILDQMGVSLEQVWYDGTLPGYRNLPLNEENAKEIAKIANVLEVRQNIDVYPPDYPESSLMIFPFSENYKWTRDNYGPIYIPAAGDTISLSIENLPLYERVISVYEGHKLEIKDGDIYIDGVLSQTYTFEMDYYFMMGDNRHNSLDSRYWGFVPEDHIVGEPKVIWFSTDRNKSFPRNIRWNRLLKFV